MNIQKALELARVIKYGPLAKSDAPLPSKEEALIIIREEQRTCGFNWLTGAAAIEALKGKQDL